jgi:beta-glucanase (GH16 family)
MIRTLFLLLLLPLFACQPGTEDNWQLVWSDEFDGPAINEENWSFEIGDGCPNLCGWGNNELQYYTQENAQIVDGHLVITAQKDSMGGKAYTSSRLVTKGKQEFQYGRMEFRAKVPVEGGVWPALWMLGSNISDVGWPQCGEIDIMEHITRMPYVIHGTIHANATRGTGTNIGGLKVGSAHKEFHVYAIEWDSDKIRFFVDDLNYFTYQPEEKNEDTWPFDQPFFFTMNVAVGGNWPGFDINEEVLPQKMLVDYVRVYGKK